jgi:hypothetical protein
MSLLGLETILQLGSGLPFWMHQWKLSLSFGSSSCCRRAWTLWPVCVRMFIAIKEVVYVSWEWRGKSEMRFIHYLARNNLIYPALNPSVILFQGKTRKTVIRGSFHFSLLSVQMSGFFPIFLPSFCCFLLLLFQLLFLASF